MKSGTVATLSVFTFILFLIYYSIAGFVFDARNPTANNISKITHFMDVIKFNKLEKFQGIKN